MMTGIMKYSSKDIMWCNTANQAARSNGPCYVSASGNLYFSQLNPQHFNRKNGPSSVIANGKVTYRNINGEPHRTDGPAVISADGSKEYWIDGYELSADKFFLKYGVL